MKLRKRHIVGAVLGTMTFLLAACAPKGIRPEAFVSQACMEADAAEARANEDMREYDVLASTLEEHEARLVELQRMKSRVVTGRMSDEELAQWQPELLPWEEPEPVVADSAVATMPEAVSEQSPEDVSVSSDTTSFGGDPIDTGDGYGFDDQSDVTEGESIEAEGEPETPGEGDTGAETESVEEAPVDQIDETSSDAPADESDASVEEETSAPIE